MRAERLAFGSSFFKWIKLTAILAKSATSNSGALLRPKKRQNFSTQFF